MLHTNCQEAIAQAVIASLLIGIVAGVILTLTLKETRIKIPWYLKKKSDKKEPET